MVPPSSCAWNLLLQSWPIGHVLPLLAWVDLLAQVGRKGTGLREDGPGTLGLNLRQGLFLAKTSYQLREHYIQ